MEIILFKYFRGPKKTQEKGLRGVWEGGGGGLANAHVLRGKGVAEWLKADSC